MGPGICFKIKLGREGQSPAKTKLAISEKLSKLRNGYKRLHSALPFGYVLEFGATFSRYTEQ